MFDRLQRFARDLTGGSDAVLVGHLVDQLDATLAGVAITRALAAGEVDTSLARERLSDVESVGDAARRALIVDLSRTLAAPMDREDMFRLSRSVDDVLDNLRDLAREFDLYRIPSEPLLVDALANVEAGVLGLREAIGSLLEAPERASLLAADAKKTDVRSSYQHAVAALLAEDREVTTEILRRRELLRRVDVTGLRLAEAADALADGAVKRSH
ncbi:DUF47 domain-containing protein [Nitriliruptor alkaliphilus]|uniref:DUF47 domain-containing protein n=1 Tax=Nitriliruptor alkaliphilus TaxID=427918 RepID=UPI00069899CD|nr:DUF47 family protein [Nitriliruptor alkaliphilus]